MFLGLSALRIRLRDCGQGQGGPYWPDGACCPPLQTLEKRSPPMPPRGDGSHRENAFLHLIDIPATP
jgi:hypothetical protein